MDEKAEGPTFGLQVVNEHFAHHVHVVRCFAVITQNCSGQFVESIFNAPEAMQVVFRDDLLAEIPPQILHNTNGC